MAAVLAPRAAAQGLQLSPSQLTFQTEVGAPSPPNQTFDIVSPSGEPFSAQVEVNIISADWLSVLPTNGTTPATVTVRVDGSRFQSAGSRTANIRVTLPQTGQSAVVRVTVDVSANQQAPRFAANPSSLTFNVSAAGVTPQPQQLTLDNSGGGILNYAVGINYPASGPQGWLAVTPDNGQVSFGTQNHTVQVVSTSGLNQGTYMAQVLFTGNGSNSPFAVQVTLNVGARPAVSATPASLSFRASQGGAFPPIQTVSIQNEGGGPLQYDIGTDQDWLFVRPLRGDATSGPVLHEVVPDTRGLPQGVYLGNLVLTSATLDAPFLVPVRLEIGPPTEIIVSPSRLDFIGNTNIPLRERRTLSLVNLPLAPGQWSARVIPESATWLRLSPRSGRLPAHLTVEVDTTNLGAGPINAQIEIQATEGNAGGLPLSPEDGPSQAVATRRIPVTMVVLANPPQLSANPPAIRFEGVSGRAVVLRQALVVENLGGPQLNWDSTVQVESDASWLSVTPNSGTAPTPIVVGANTSNLPAGVYHGRVILSAGPQRTVVPTTLTLYEREPRIDTAQSAYFWEVVQGGPPLESVDVQVYNRGINQTNWSVQARSEQSPWLAITPSAGVANEDGSAGPNTFNIAPSTAGLPLGQYDSLIEVRGLDGPSPRLITAALRVISPNETPQRSVTPGGMVFRSVGGAQPTPRTAVVRRRRAGTPAFQAGASTVTGGPWLSVMPENGTTPENGAVELTIGVDPTGLQPGIRRGAVSITFGDGLVETIPVTYAVAPAGGPCTATAIGVAPLSPHQGFRARTGRGRPLEVAIVDDCARMVDNASVAALFESGEPGIQLESIGNGRYAATWTPSISAGQSSIQFLALSGVLSATGNLVGAVEASTNQQPSLAPYGVVNGASFAPGEAISPGSIVSLFGRNFSMENQAAQAIPLPTTLGGVTLFMGGRPAPLYFSSLGQVNAQTPFELRPGAHAQAVARVNGRYSTPVEFPVANARPGLFLIPTQVGLNRAIVVNQDGSLNSPENPAAIGEAIVAYLTGIGEVSPPTATGAAAPAAEPLARATLSATATIGETATQPFFLGLTPGFVGLAQANLTIPPGTRVGPEIPLTIEIDGQVSNVLAIAVQGAR